MPAMRSPAVSPTTPRRRAAVAVTIAGAMALAFGFVAACPRTPPPAPTPTTPTLHSKPVQPTPIVAQDGGTAPSRTAVEPTVPTASAAPAATFEQRVDELAHLAQRTADLAERDEIDAARDSDAAARGLLGALLVAFDDAGERALGILAAMPVPDTDPLTPARRGVLRIVLQTDLAQRLQTAQAVHDSTRVDALTAAVLDVMPGTDITVADGEYALADQPYLHLVHEPAVLGLVRLAGEERFSRPVATRLLLTLWHNVQQNGERSSDELSRLALLMLAESDPTQRIIACRQLLLDARYRPLVLSWLREHGDRAVANELASIAARDLPAGEALAVLRELGPVLPRAPNAYVTLGFRAPGMLADAYRDLLANNTQPQQRTDLLAGMIMAPGELGLEIAQLALDNDPSPDVRIQAAYAFCARRDGDGAERAIDRLLDDAAVRNDPARLSALVLAFQNLEAGGDVNAIDRLGQRLQSLALPEESRQLLAGILQRALPGGGSGGSPGGSTPK